MSRASTAVFHEEAVRGTNSGNHHFNSNMEVFWECQVSIANVQMYAISAHISRWWGSWNATLEREISQNVEKFGQKAVAFFVFEAPKHG